MKRLICILLSCVMVLSLVACGGGGGSETDPTGGGGSETGGSSGGSEVAEALQPNTDADNTETSDETLVVALGSEPSTLFGPAGGKIENEEQIINSALLDTLVDYNYVTGEVEPCLATAWEWVDDTHLRFTLREGVTMSDGTPLVAEDVVFSANMWRDQNATTDTGKYIAGAVAEDEQTVVIEFNTVAPDFLSLMSYGTYGIVSEAEVEAAGGFEGVQQTPIIGCGPYKFVSWEKGQSVTIERNDDYWNAAEDPAYFKTVRFTFVNDAGTRAMSVQSGNADVAYNMPINQAATYVSDTSVKTTIYPFGQVIHLWYNMGENAGATSDPLVREAIDKALDFDAIAQVATAGYGEASLSYFDTSCPYYKANYTAEERAVDIEGAKELMEQAGYADGLELNILGMLYETTILAVMQSCLSQIGITLNIDTPDTAQFVEAAMGGDYDLICVGDMPAIRTPATVCPFLQTLNVEGPGMVIGGPKWTTDEIDTLISNIITAEDNTAAETYATEFDSTIKEQTICSNLYPELIASVYATDLKGYCRLERGYIDVTELYK